MNWLVVNFGKYKGKGKTIPQIIFNDPDWFFWSIENNAWANKGIILYEQSKDVYHKSRRILNLDLRSGLFLVEYNISDSRSIGFEIVEHDRVEHSGSTKTFRDDHLDLMFPRSIRDYDKLGYKIFLHSFKNHFLNSHKSKFTKKLCEGFFENEDNF